MTIAALGCAALLIGACGKDPPAPIATIATIATAATVPADAAMVAPGPRLPGRIWFASARGLERLEGGVRTVIAPQVFPSGAQIGSRLVGIRSRGDGSEDGEQLVLVDDAGTVTSLGFAAMQVRDPAVDPRGEWIVVAANRDGHGELYRLEVATGVHTQLTTNPEGNFAPASLDATSIVFVSSRDGDSELYRMPAAGGPATRLTAFHRDDWDPTPSPDGTTIAFVSDREGLPRIFLVAADGTQLRRLTTRVKAEVDELAPTWSPDGTALAYVAERTSGGAIWLHTLATHAERSLSPNGARDATPAFSPDGVWILTARGRGHDVDLWALACTPGVASVQVTADAGAETVPRWVPIPARAPD